ncbi:hypothetical protein RCO48_30845 [Peribacillus frigoritolerans]|nr:hypothetical protein [Peribacillus frigoritolerans]
MKIAKFPLIERVEFIVVSIWLLLILPNISVKNMGRLSCY